MPLHNWIAGLLLLTLAEPAADNSTHAFANSPLPGSIIVVSKSHNWSIEELCKTGLDYLERNASLPKGTKFSPIVHVLLDDKMTMCEILYLQGFGRPYWRVKIGYDGQASGYEKGMKREG